MTSASVATICSGTSVSIALTSSIASTYTWIATNNANTSGESTTNQTTGTINDLITNNTTTVQAVTYTVTPTSSGGCGIGSPQIITVTVKPAPTMTNASTTTMCSGDSINLPLTSNFTSNYTWITSNNTNTTGEDTTLQITDILTSVIANYTTSNQALTYTVIPTSTFNGCTGTLQTVTVTVRPASAMTSASADTVCSGSNLTISFTSNISSSYTWIAANNTHTAGESTTLQTSSTFSNTITSDTSSIQIVTYTVTPTSTAGGCVGIQ